jgi:hypothetical protein
MLKVVPEKIHLQNQLSQIFPSTQFINLGITSVFSTEKRTFQSTNGLEAHILVSMFF